MAEQRDGYYDTENQSVSVLTKGGGSSSKKAIP